MLPVRRRDAWADWIAASNWNRPGADVVAARVSQDSASAMVAPDQRVTSWSPSGTKAPVSLRRASGAVVAPDDALTLHAADTLVLSGLPEPLALAEGKLLGRA